MTKILANDGLDREGVEILEDAGFEVDITKIPQEELPNKLPAYDAIIVRSATKVRRDLIDQCPNLKLIGRAGVGMDNIDVDYARSQDITVINTPGASSSSVAELVFAHLFAMSRFLHQSNRELPKGDFKALKKKYSAGTELNGKILGIMGLGQIGQEVARIGVCLGMEVLAYDPNVKEVYLSLDHLPIVPTPEIGIESISKDEVLERSDFITFHVPFKEGGEPLITHNDFMRMKEGVGIVNCSRGGVVAEADLLSGLNSGKIAFCGLDTFQNEPNVNSEILKHEKVSISPHIGGSTVEAQKRIGIEIAEKIVDFFKAH